jgi:hypothetical protein
MGKVQIGGAAAESLQKYFSDYFCIWLTECLVLHPLLKERLGKTLKLGPFLFLRKATFQSLLIEQFIIRWMGE